MLLIEKLASGGWDAIGGSDYRLRASRHSMNDA